MQSSLSTQYSQFFYDINNQNLQQANIENMQMIKDCATKTIEYVGNLFQLTQNRYNDNPDQANGSYELLIAMQITIQTLYYRTKGQNVEYNYSAKMKHILQNIKKLKEVTYQPIMNSQCIQTIRQIFYVKVQPVHYEQLSEHFHQLFDSLAHFFRNKSKNLQRYLMNFQKIQVFISWKQWDNKVISKMTEHEKKQSTELRKLISKICHKKLINYTSNSSQVKVNILKLKEKSLIKSQTKDQLSEMTFRQCRQVIYISKNVILKGEPHQLKLELAFIPHCDGKEQMNFKNSSTKGFRQSGEKDAISKDQLNYISRKAYLYKKSKNISKQQPKIQTNKLFLASQSPITSPKNRKSDKFNEISTSNLLRKKNQKPNN